MSAQNRMKVTKGLLRAAIVMAACTLVAIIALAADPTDVLVDAANKGDVMKLLIIALVAETAVIGWLVRTILVQNKEGSSALANVASRLDLLIDELKDRPCLKGDREGKGSKSWK